MTVLEEHWNSLKMVLIATAIDVSDPSYQKELERSSFSLFLRSGKGKFFEISSYTNFQEFTRNLQFSL